MQRRLLGHIKRGHVRAMINQYLYSVSPSYVLMMTHEGVIVLSIYISIEMENQRRSLALAQSYDAKCKGVL